MFDKGLNMEFYASALTRAARLPFSEAVRVGDVMYLSGQVGNLPGKLELAPGGIEAETRQMMENIRSTLERLGRSLDDVFRCSVMLRDMTQWGAFNDVYVSYFKQEWLPVRTAFGVADLVLGAAVEMECWAAAE
jgi:2-iminobutanoate/2-iminopropanoate deaminase